MGKTLLAAMGIMGVLCGVALAGQINATTADGRKVTLYPDGRWEFRRDHADKKPKAVETLLKNAWESFGIRYDTSKWTLREGGINDNAVFEFQHADGDAYAVVIAERIQIPLSALKSIVLQNAQIAAPDARIVFEEKRTVSDKDVLCLIIDGTVQHIPFTYLGYYHAGEAGTIQVITYTGQNLFNEYKADMEDLLNGLEIYR